MRQVAKHIYIREILEGEYEEREGWDPNVIHTARGDVSRVNLIAAFLVVSGQQVLDDGTGQIPLRAFEEVPGLREAHPGKVVQVVGRPRKYSDSYYLIPEVIREVAPGWAAVRKKELGEVQVRQPAPAPKPAPVEAAEEPDNNADKVISIISGLDAGDGADVQAVVDQSGLGDSAEHIINQLLLDGEIFEIRPGVVKVL